VNPKMDVVPRDLWPEGCFTDSVCYLLLGLFLSENIDSLALSAYELSHKLEDSPQLGAARMQTNVADKGDKFLLLQRRSPQLQTFGLKVVVTMNCFDVEGRHYIDFGEVELFF
jgi:hypothetical protein